MRILVTVSDQCWGGKHRYMTDAVLGLRRGGHSVVVVVESGGSMERAMRTEDVQVRSVASFEDAEQAAQTLQAELADIDVVCATGRRDAGALHLATLHATDALLRIMFRHSAFPLAPEELATAFVRDAHLVVATSWQQVESQLKEFDSATQQVQVLASAVSTDLADAVSRVDTAERRADWAIPNDAVVFSVLSRLSWEKGVDRILRALAAMEVSPDEVVLLIAGEGDLEPELRSLADELGVSECVRWLGHVDDVRQVLAVSDVVVLGSTVPETGPLALKEAMAAGKPVIAPRIGGIPEFVAHSSSGLLFDDDTQLLDAMNSLAWDQALAATMGRQGAIQVRGEHALDVRLDTLLTRLQSRALEVMPLEVPLADLQWGDARHRKEHSGGLVFVPPTSEIAPLDQRSYSVVARAITDACPSTLLELDAAEARGIVRLLFDMGALRRRSTCVAATT